MRDVRHKRKHDTTACFFRGEILRSGGLVLTAEAPPNVCLPGNGCDRDKRSLFLTFVGGYGAHEFIFAMAAADRVIEERKVLGACLRCDLAGLFNTRYSNLEVIIVSKCGLDEVF